MTKYPDELRAQVTAALLAGQSVSSVAKEYNLPKQTVSSWKHRSPVKVQPKKDLDVSDLILDYLKANLEALKAQAQVFADPAWLKSQSGSEAAVLHGVMTDKAIRLLEALSHATNSPTA